MRSTFKILFYLKKSNLQPDGKAPVMGRITVNSTVTQFSCKLSIRPDLWDTKANRAVGKSLEVQKINEKLDNIRVQINKHYQRISDADAYVSAAKVRDAYLGFGEGYKTLLSLFQEHNENFAKRVRVDRSPSSFRKYRSVQAKLAGFIEAKYHVKDILLKELEPKFIEDFALYLMVDCSMASSSATIYMRPIKRMITKAHNRGWIARNPFADYHPKMEVRERGFLNDAQLKRFMTQKLELPGQCFVRDMFVFCCFTGLSHIDLKNLTHDNLKTMADGSRWIVTKRQKTKVPTNVRLLDVPLRLIEKYSAVRTEGNKVFNVFDLTYTNLILKKIAKQCEFGFNLSFHCLRHMN